MIYKALKRPKKWPNQDRPHYLKVVQTPESDKSIIIQTSDSLDELQKDIPSQYKVVIMGLLDIFYQFSILETLKFKMLKHEKD